MDVKMERKARRSDIACGAGHLPPLAAKNSSPASVPCGNCLVGDSTPALCRRSWRPNKPPCTFTCVFSKPAQQLPQRVHVGGTDSSRPGGTQTLLVSNVVHTPPVFARWPPGH